MKENNILTADWQTVQSDNIDIENIKLPCVVKPTSCGSSVGISLATTKEELKKSLEEAKKWEDQIIIEEMIKGRNDKRKTIKEKQ